ncbi:MAG: glycosyltransferase family 39 protein [Armatimonadota bacterium]|nr:glycosyltransferase family 39 protein [Armatimonadota bacterium]
MRADEAQRETRRRLLLAVLLVAGIALVYLLYNVSRFDRVTNVNAMDYAQIARHVLRGEGFTTSFIKPLSLLSHRSVENHPDLSYPPMHILWTAGLMKLLGPTDRAVSHSSGLAFLLTMPVMFILALRLFDWRTAVLGTAVFGTHFANLGYAVSGLEASLLTLEVTLLILVVYRASAGDRHEMAWVALAGLIAGLIYMTKYVWLAGALPVAVYLALMRPERRLARVAVFVAVIAVVSVPWLYRNYRLTGNPFFTLRVHEMIGRTRAFPANSIYRRFSEQIPSYLVFAADNPRAVFEKVRQDFSRLYRTFHDLGGAFVTPFFLVGVLVRLGNDRVERLRYLVYGMLAAVSIVLMLVMASPRLVAPLGPIATILAVFFFWRLLEARLQSAEERARTRWTALAVGALILLHVHPFVTEVTPDEPWYEAGEQPVETAMKQLQGQVDDVLLTDVPWQAAWMADMDAVWVPQTKADLNRLEDAVGRFRWLLLTPAVARMAAPEGLEEWAKFWAQAQQGDAEYLGFVPAARLGNGRFILMRRLPERD